MKIGKQGGSGKSWKLNREAVQQLLDLLVEGHSYQGAANILEERLGIHITKETVEYQAAKHRDYIYHKRRESYERAMVWYPVSTFEGRAAQRQDVLEKLGALSGNLFAKFRAILEVLKAASQDEVAMRTQLLKERQCGGDERAEREEIQRRFLEITRELA